MYQFINSLKICWNILQVHIEEISKLTTYILLTAVDF